MSVLAEQSERVRVVEQFFDSHPHEYHYRREGLSILERVKKSFPKARIAWASWGWPSSGKRRFSIVIKDPSFAAVNAGKEIPILEVE